MLNYDNYDKQCSCFSGIDFFIYIKESVCSRCSHKKGHFKLKSFPPCIKRYLIAIDFCSNGRDWNFISAYGDGAKWAKKIWSGVVGFTKDTLKRLLNTFYKIVTVNSGKRCKVNYWYFDTIFPAGAERINLTFAVFIS